MNNRLYAAPLALAACLLTLHATPAAAALVVSSDGTVTVTGDSGGTGTINFDGNSEGNTVSGLTSALSLTFVNAVAGLYTFDYTLSNTSSGTTTEARVTAFAFDTTPNVTDADILAGSVFDNILLASNLPNGVGNVELCFTTGNCTGGGSAGDGVQIGDAASGTFTLDFGDMNLDSLVLADFAVRYQGITATGISGGSGTGTSVGAVPEPGTWAMMLLGFGAIGFATRRRRSAFFLRQVA